MQCPPADGALSRSEYDVSSLPQSATGASSRSRVFTRLSHRRRPSPLVRASTGKNVRQSIIPLVTRIFIDLILLLIGPRQRELDRPRSRKRGGIVDRHLVCDRVGRDAPKAFDEVQMFARAAVVRPVREIVRV